MTTPTLESPTAVEVPTAGIALEDTETIALLAAHKLAAESGNEPDHRYRDVLVERYLPLVRAIGRKMRSRLTPNVELADLVSSGVLGLMDAINGFDETKCVKFETYCTIRVRGSMLDELRERDWVPRLVRRRANKIDATRRTLAAEFRRDASDEEVAARLEIPVGRFQEMLQEVKQPAVFVSLDIIRFEDGDSRGVSKLDMVPDPKSEDPGEHAALSDVMRTVLSCLNRREKLIMLLYYQRGFTMKRIGSVFGMSESRVCQIHTRIMKRLRRRIRAGQLGV